ncbi:FAD-dependent oxidoreductase [Nonomuraea endophytica]|uniref:Assimilatory nitrate reductase electron transfer subunit n=1 Tax=Nonomuraea endophytica TaxID=714136 RepID=A0A7W8AC85_9ACTN|nr:FAD-dependent oxidoreductase [Nonomuraea endophytica]MBB5083626.1 assimilatory nitrate reductase electron transfer subunit [Nonomuraea endophytica]
MRIVVIGNGMAGARLAGDPRLRHAHVTVFGAEPRLPYNRVLLSGVLAGTTQMSQLTMPLPEGVDTRFGVKVTAIDRAARQVVAEDGSRTAYDVCVLATGSEPIMPAMPGIELTIPFRTLDDCERILGRARGVRDAVVIGGGLLGIEAARGLAMRGIRVTVVHLAGHLMERQLDPAGGEVLARTLAGLGITVHVGVSVAAVEPTRVLLADGTAIEAGLAIASCGVRPVTSLARAAGLAVERGVVVDDLLRTSDPAVYAIGECAQHRGVTYGLVGPCWEQAAVLAAHLTGEPLRYSGSRTVTRLKAPNLELASLGDVHADGETVTFSHPSAGIYRKLVIRDRRLAGAILLGRSDAVGTLTQLYDRQSEVPAARESLLFPELAAGDVAPGPAALAGTATICQCNAVSKTRIRTAWLAGAGTAAAVSRETRAGTGCGTCLPVIESLLGSFEDSLAPVAEAG